MRKKKPAYKRGAVVSRPADPRGRELKRAVSNSLFLFVSLYCLYPLIRVLRDQTIQKQN
jgi:hypothetical protein